MRVSYLMLYSYYVCYFRFVVCVCAGVLIPVEVSCVADGVGGLIVDIGGVAFILWCVVSYLLSFFLVFCVGCCLRCFLVCSFACCAVCG